MRNSPLLAGLSDDECKMLAISARKRTYAPDEVIFLQGTPIEHVILIEAGTIKLTRAVANGEVVLWMCGPSDSIGISSETPFSRHSCTARAIKDCSVLTWESRLIQQLLHEFPQVKANLDNIVARRLKELEQRFCEMSNGNMAYRLGRALVRLAGSIGREEEAGVRVSLSREELAGVAGLSMFTVSRLITKWAHQGLILPRREAVVVCSPNRLAEMCHAYDDGSLARECDPSETYA